ncbi:MAG: hypothetical protein E6I85_14240 [Chloroflexi bacterium]|nr:MAG: hypothetical protein E6I85_14240 [Chloroflexota bacterium]
MSRRSIFLVLLAFLPALLSVQGTSAANLSFGVAMQSAAAARQVPLPIVEAVAWVNSRWEWIPQPSVDGGVGPMNIHPYDLELAASLSGHDPALLRTDLSANLDAGAAFLAHYHGSGTDLASWRPAVAMLLGDGAATEVFDALRSGASRVTNEGEAISLTPQSVPAGKAPAALPRSGDYPPANWVAASPANYSSANRPHDWPIDLIVIHDTEGSYASAIAEFQNPAAQSSAHFVVSTGGAITQMVREQDVAWHAGNWDYNTRSVGIEHEGYAWSCCWYTTAQYNASAGISASICSRFGVPMDRSHVIGHSDVPDPNNPGLYGGSGHHTDPGPYWNWSYYMATAQADANALPSPPHLMTYAHAVASSPEAVTVTWLAARSCHAPVDGITITAQPGNIVQSLPGTATSATFTGLQDRTNYTFTVTAHNGYGTDTIGSNQVQVTATTFTVTSYSSLHLGQDNDGATWVEVDPTLRITTKPTVNQYAIVSANIDLWTTRPGYNQDVGIFISDNNGSEQLFGWKESGGFAGTYSPNAAFVQTVASLLAGHTYVFKLKLKSNIPAPGGTVYAGAGTADTGFSPTRLTVHLLPPADVATSTGWRSYHLDGYNDGGFGSWVEIDPGLRVNLAGVAGETALVTGNLDLWTTHPGYNQDVGIFASDNGGPDRQLAWKESGGFAGTYSPNAAFVQAALGGLQAGHNYTFKLKWKPNIAAGGGIVYAGAGTTSTGFSPTRLTAVLEPAANVLATSNSTHYGYPYDDDGSTWYELVPTVRVNARPGVSSIAVASGNADLWTATAGYNQDLAIFACDLNAYSCTSISQYVELGWKESGGFAGTYSPNAASVQGVLPLLAGHSYLFGLFWKPNIAAPASALNAGAGTSSTQFSPTSLVVEVT